MRVRWVVGGAVAVTVMCGSAASGQTLLDRVVARVNGVPVALSDVRAGMAMGLVVAAESDLPLAIEQWIQRLLLLAEVERFPPPEPGVEALGEEETRIRARVGEQFAADAARTGLDERRVRQSARDTLRIRAYLDQRFGVDGQVSDAEARAYFAANVGQFTRDGVVPPFEQVEAAVRQRAGALRRQTAIDQWIGDLRERAEVVVNP